MARLAVQVVTHNNEETIQTALESLEPLEAEVWVLDHGSTDHTTEIAARYAKTRPINQRSEGRNSMIQESDADWFFTLEPWEKLAAGHAAILNTTRNALPGRVFVTQGDILTKPIRLWPRQAGFRFTGPAFESFQCEQGAISVNALVSAALVDHTEYNLGLLQEWKKTTPTVPTPYYYEAMIHLAKYRWDDFLRLAEHFLFRSTTMSMPVVLTRYYMAVAHCQAKRNAHDSLKNLMVCLSVKPLMAEFWCLLADIHYFLQHDFDKAYRFYDNALVMGSKRKTGDEWPVQLSKYGEYPKKMLESIKAIRESRKLIY